MSKDFRKFLEDNHDETTQKAMIAWRNQILDQERESIAKEIDAAANKSVSDHEAGGLLAAVEIVRKRKGTYE